VIESAYLLRVLRQVRDRARARAALEGALAGAAVGLGATTLFVAAARARGTGASWHVGLELAGGGAALGLALGAARRISLVRCARWLDRALDRSGPSRDRVLSALALVDAPSTPFSRAAIADAIARAGRLSPKRVAPARRPRGLPALAGTALALALVALLPARAPGARRDTSAATTPTEARLEIGAGALDAEREAARDAALAAAAHGDDALARLAAELAAATRALESGALPRGEALDRLSALATRAHVAAAEAEHARAAVRAAAATLEPTAATRTLGRALADDDAAATDSALADLAARAASSDGAARAGIARALGAAGAAVAASDGAPGASSADQRRRLAREPEAAATVRTSEGADGDIHANDRRLEHLSRDLEDAATACRGDAAACARGVRAGQPDLSSLARDAGDADARQRLESAVRQARERLRRGDLDGRGDGAVARSFARAARGEGRDGETSGPRGAEASAAAGVTGIEGVPGGGDDPAFSDGAGDGKDPAGEPATDPGGASTDGRGAQGTSQAVGQGAGIGHEAGGEALASGATPPTRGHEVEAHLRNGAGPTRSEVIEASARRGFATGDYGRVFEDYEPVVEESLAAGAVPEGRRYLVRRYFQLIRPRAAAAPRDARAPRAP
jgi:trimeric autotransporter adhesin